MAGDWIKVRVDLHCDPSVIGIATALELDEDTVTGKLIRLWSWADQQTENGNAHCVTEKWIDRYLGVTGFAVAMQNVGWLQIKDDGIVFPDFNKHNGQSGKQRALTAKRQAAFRAKKGDDASVTKALPREEKRREDISDTPIVPKGTSSRKRKNEKPNKYSEAFLKFWELYPKQRREEKPKAFEAWKNACKRTFAKGGIEYLLDRVAAYQSFGESKGPYCPQPATWLNQDRFDDSPESWARSENGNGKPNNEQPLSLAEEARKARQQ